MAEQLTPDGDPELDGRLAEIAARSRRRWLVSMGGVVLVVAVAVPLLDPVLHGRPSHRRTVHHSAGTTVAVVVVSVVVLLTLVGALVWMLTRRRGVFAAPLTAGLPRAARRGVGRTLRRGGPPSADPVTRAVEVRTAERIVAQAGPRRYLADAANDPADPPGREPRP